MANAQLEAAVKEAEKRVELTKKWGTEAGKNVTGMNRIVNELNSSKFVSDSLKISARKELELRKAILQWRGIEVQAASAELALRQAAVKEDDAKAFAAQQAAKAKDAATKAAAAKKESDAKAAAAKTATAKAAAAPKNAALKTAAAKAATEAATAANAAKTAATGETSAKTNASRADALAKAATNDVAAKKKAFDGYTASAANYKNNTLRNLEREKEAKKNAWLNEKARMEKNPFYKALDRVDKLIDDALAIAKEEIQNAKDDPLGAAANALKLATSGVDDLVQGAISLAANSPWFKGTKVGTSVDFANTLVGLAGVPKDIAIDGTANVLSAIYKSKSVKEAYNNIEKAMKDTKAQPFMTVADKFMDLLKAYDKDFDKTKWRDALRGMVDNLPLGMTFVKVP